MTRSYLRTSDLARAAGIHPNTVRLYLEWGLLPPVERSAAGYRLFTRRHLDCLLLARLVYQAEYPGRNLRASSNAIIQQAVAGDWPAALQMAQDHQRRVHEELEYAHHAADLLEHWAGRPAVQERGEPLAIHQVSSLLGVSQDVIRNWERNGLISVPRNSYNGYRIFGSREIERLRIIRMLSQAGYSHMAILRMFIELDGGNTRNLKKVLDTPRDDGDIFTAADHWLTTLLGQKSLAQQVIRMIEAVLSGGGEHEFG
jgi:DNA-binding transcriptional MerR regulator